MKRSEDRAEGATPALGELFTRYLHGQAAAQAEGLGRAAPAGEVEPYDAAPVQPVDPQAAWREAVAAAAHLAPKPAPSWSPPPDWPALVAAHEPATALAFCLGNFPQLVRALQPLLHGADLTGLRPQAGRPTPAPALEAWAARAEGEAARLLAAGALRLAGRLDDAAALLDRVPDGPWQALRDNERAALAWRGGDAARAAALWRQQPDSVPVLFNRGMAALFLGRAAEARAPLTRAVEQLADGDSWHHLGRLYLALAGARR
jgi:hypothetical protein